MVKLWSIIKFPRCCPQSSYKAIEIYWNHRAPNGASTPSRPDLDPNRGSRPSWRSVLGQVPGIWSLTGHLWHTNTQLPQSLYRCITWTNGIGKIWELGSSGRDSPFLYVCMYVCLPACLAVCLSGCLSVCLYVSMYLWIYVCNIM